MRPALPPVRAGWTRDYEIYLNGYVKDMDFYGAFSQTVAPLPFRRCPAIPTPSPSRTPTPTATTSSIGTLAKCRTRTPPAIGFSIPGRLRTPDSGLQAPGSGLRAPIRTTRPGRAQPRRWRPDLQVRLWLECRADLQVRLMAGLKPRPTWNCRRGSGMQPSVTTRSPKPRSPEPGARSPEPAACSRRPPLPRCAAA